MGQITSNLLIKAFATWEHAFVCTKIVLSATFFKKLGFLDNKVIYIFRISCCCCCRFCFCLSFSVFSYLFVAVFDLLLGLLPVQEILLSIIEMGKLCHIVVKCTLEGIFTQICEHFCAYYRLKWSNLCNLGITTWSLERPFPPTELEYKWCQFWSKVMTSDMEQRPVLKMTSYGWHRRQWIKHRPTRRNTVIFSAGNRVFSSSIHTAIHLFFPKQAR